MNVYPVAHLSLGNLYDKCLACSPFQLLGESDSNVRGHAMLAASASLRDS